jgi:hypothetical protein
LIVGVKFYAHTKTIRDKHSEWLVVVICGMCVCL